VFGDLDDERAGLQAGLGEGLPDPVGELRILQLERVDVDRQPQLIGSRNAL